MGFLHTFLYFHENKPHLTGRKILPVLSQYMKRNMFINDILTINKIRVSSSWSFYLMVLVKVTTVPETFWKTLLKNILVCEK